MKGLPFSIWLSLLLQSHSWRAIDASTPAPNGIVLRIRKADGSMGRISIPQEKQDSTTLADVLSTFDEGNDQKGGDGAIKCTIGTNRDPVSDTNQSVSSLGLKHGSLISIKSSPRPTKSDPKTPKDKATTIRYTDFDPYPDIAKASSYSAAARRAKALARLPSKRGMSYSEISKLQSNMHTVEPQPTGPITRVYMCAIGAQRFKDSTAIVPTKAQRKAGKTEIEIQNRCAVLWGSVNTERVDRTPRKARTSLSTPLSETKMCQVVKVHAVWEPPQSNEKNGPYDASNLFGIHNGKEVTKGKGGKNAKEFERAVRVANALGLKPLGWIYAYSESRHSSSDSPTNTNASAATDASGQDALPVWGRDIVTGAQGQIRNMERLGRDEGKEFITLALDANTGATEAFQLSDVCVQMVAEGVLNMPPESKRVISTQDPVIVDNKETHELDSVLALVNTALLSHSGSFSGKQGVNSVKKSNGALLNKVKKSLLNKLDSDEAFLDQCADFNILMALDKMLGAREMEELCQAVKKYSKGQRKGASLGADLKVALKSLLEH